MADLREVRYVKCSYHRARDYLAKAIDRAMTKGDPQVMRLRVPVADLDLEKDVLVTFEAGADPRHFDQPWRIRWAPVGDGPYPTFKGTLTVRSAEDYDSSILELAGTYNPPLGAFGKAFDAALGHRIARATAEDLLEAIGSRMEAGD